MQTSHLFDTSIHPTLQFCKLLLSLSDCPTFSSFVLIFSFRSFYSSERFADIPIPPTEDWEAATGEVGQKLSYCIITITSKRRILCCDINTL